tara:strand:+ start:376 stop:657 length:282 start_codon:yes stop_codon:yes gene_type:complete
LSQLLQQPLPVLGNGCYRYPRASIRGQQSDLSTYTALAQMGFYNHSCPFRIGLIGIAANDDGIFIGRNTLHRNNGQQGCNKGICEGSQRLNHR